MTAAPSLGAAPGGRPRWAYELAFDADRLRSMKPDWDGPGSIRPSDITIDRMVWLTSVALHGEADAQAPALIPAGDGSLQAEWHRYHGRLEFCLAADGAVDVWVELRADDGVVELADEGAWAIERFCRYARRLATTPAPADATAAEGETVCPDAMRGPSADDDGGFRIPTPDDLWGGDPLDPPWRDTANARPSPGRRMDDAE